MNRCLVPIPYGHQSINSDDIKRVLKTLRSNWLTQGPAVNQFEMKLAHKCDVPFAVALSSGTAALHLAVLATGLSNEDEGITSPITFVATSNSIIYCGGKPLFADIEYINYPLISPAKIAALISPATKVVIPVHYSGLPADMPEIHKIVRHYSQKYGRKIYIIEDAAHALGATYTYKGKTYKVGSCHHSDMAILSFHPVKHITTGEGGAILTRDKNLYEKILLLRNHGITKSYQKLVYRSHAKESWYYEMQELGYNYRLTDIQSALGISQLSRLDEFIRLRRKVASYYTAKFKNNPYFDLIDTNLKNFHSSYHIYPLLLRDKLCPNKASIVTELKNKGINTQVHYIPVYLHPFYRKKYGYKEGNCPIAEEYYKRTLTIPLYPSMTKKDYTYVSTTILSTLSKYNT